MMNRLFRAMEYTARMVVCTPIPEGYSFERLSKPQKALHFSSLLFDFVDFIDMILDTYQGFRITFTGERPMFGVFLLGGIVIARLIASNGKRVLLNGGLQWAPFFQDRREFYQRVGPHTALPSLFALLFTEISVFMFEDATMLSIWIATDSYDKSDIFDRLNSWVTLLSVVMCLSLLLGSILAWLRFWKWETNACSVVCQILSAISFLIIFGIIILFLIGLVFLGFQTIAGKELDEQIPFLVLVVLSWVFGSFFACTLRQESRVPLIQDASWREDDGNQSVCDVNVICDQQEQDDTNVEATSVMSNSDNNLSSSEVEEPLPVVSPNTVEEYHQRDDRQQAVIMISTNISSDSTGAVDDIEANIVPFAQAVVLEQPIGNDGSASR